MNDKVAKTGPKQAKREKYFELIGVGQPSPKQLAEAQRLAREIGKAEVKIEAKEAKKLSASEKDKLLYEARLTETRLALSSLERSKPATDAQVTAFEQALQAARPLADAAQYGAALKKLKAVDPSKAYLKGNAAWNAAVDNAAKRAPDAIDEARRINVALAAKDLRLPADAVGRIRDEVTDWGRPLLVDKPSTAVIATATDGLKQLRLRVERDIADGATQWLQVELLRAESSRVLERVAPRSGDDPPLLTDREVAPMRLALSSAATSHASNHFAEARQVLEPLLAELQDIEARVGPLRQTWAALARQLQPRWAEAQKLASEAKSPQVREDASALAASLDEVRTRGVGRGVGYPEAIARVEGAADRIAELQQVELAWLAFNGHINLRMARRGRAADDPTKAFQAAKSRVDAALQAVDDAMHRLQAAVVAADGQARVVAASGLAERRASAAATWAHRVARAHDLTSLDEAGMQAELVALRREIDGTTNDSIRLAALMDTAGLAQAKQDFEKARDAARAACERFAAFDVAAAAPWLARVEDACTEAKHQGTAGGYRRAMHQLRMFSARAQDGERARVEAVRMRQEELQALLEPVPGQLDELRALAQKIRTGAKQQPVVALLETLQGTLDGLRAMQKLTQLPMLRESIDEAVAFAAEVADSLAAVQGGGEPSGSVSFGDARRTLAELKGRLDHKDARLYMVETQFALSERRKALEQGLGSTTMSKLSADLDALSTAVETMKTEAAKAKADAKTFESEKLAPLKAKLKAKAFGYVPDHRKALEGRIQGLLNDFRFESGRPGAPAAADQLGQEIDGLLASPVNEAGVPKALAAKQAEAEKAKNEERIAQGKWAGESKVLSDRLKRLAAINPSEIKALQDSLDSAKTSVDKSGDFASGRDQLQAIRNRLALIEANPQGLAITARNKLPQVKARARAAIAAYGRALDGLGQKVSQLDDADLDADGKRAVAQQLSTLRGLFNASVFDDPIAKMADKGSDRERRSGAREQALREVRRLQAYLNHDFRMRTLAQTPFVDGMPSVLSELALSLLDLENNVLVSI